MTLQETAIEGVVVGLIAGISSLIAITATHTALPSMLDIFTASLAGLLAGFVRFGTLMGYHPPE